jgi:hypothetical protein
MSDSQEEQRNSLVEENRGLRVRAGDADFGAPMETIDRGDIVLPSATPKVTGQKGAERGL